MPVNKIETYRVKPTRPIQHSPLILSNIDYLPPKIYIFLHYFFKNVHNEKNFMDVHKLRESLGDILCDYYPLAGQFKKAPEGKMSIVSSDKGVPFVVAESPDITIQQIEEKNWEHSSILDGLLPLNHSLVYQFPESDDAPLFAVQHTTLADGSVVLGVAMHHSVTDGYGFFDFLENWGLQTRQKQITPPIHDRSLLKASGNPPTREHPVHIVYDPSPTAIKMPPTMPPMSRKIFYFSKDNLRKLRDDYSSKDSNDSWISTNDALTAHLWRVATRARGTPLDTKVLTSVTSNGRKKLIPPLPQNYFGNVAMGVYLEMLVSELINGPKSNIALNIRKAVEGIDDSLIRSEIDWIEQQPNKLVITTDVKSFCGNDFVVMSLAKFPMYDLDFGYGTPIKCRLNNRVLDGLAVIIETPANDDGLEVYICLITEHMRKLEQDPEFKMYL